jgi:transglutaminase-like putative cysteine protease
MRSILARWRGSQDNMTDLFPPLSQLLHSSPTRAISSAPKPGAPSWRRSSPLLARHVAYGKFVVLRIESPMDFAGWFEAYLGGHWYTFDPRNIMPRIGRALIAQGRIAADMPITHTFGPNTLVSFKVWTDEVS